ncbi:hypothetical protein HY375_00920 [Candidatus Berkelbacteria bacterium]|nr:hypothetical protein [Candidatus Berkelbacteria bacterium]
MFKMQQRVQVSRKPGQPLLERLNKDSYGRAPGRLLDGSDLVGKIGTIVGEVPENAKRSDPLVIVAFGRPSDPPERKERIVLALSEVIGLSD